MLPAVDTVRYLYGRKSFAVRNSSLDHKRIKDLTPTISVITPSFNQGQFIERTILSVLDQSGDFRIEFRIVDGASSDNTIDILRKYSAILRKGRHPLKCRGLDFKWVSETDGGQADAVNKGIRMSSGQIIAWINSDDIFYPGAFRVAADVLLNELKTDAIYGLAHYIDEHDVIMARYPTEPWDYRRLMNICYLCQPAVFFSRNMVNEFGPLNPTLKYCMDYELWLRYGNHKSFGFIRKFMAGSRMYMQNKSLGQSMKVHHEINCMLKQTLGWVPREWIYRYSLIADREMPKNRAIRKMDLDSVREIAQDSFIRWWGHVPETEIEYMDRFLSSGKTNAWPVSLKIHGHYRLRIGIVPQDIFPRTAGLQEFSRMIISSMAQKYPSDQFIIYENNGEQSTSSGESPHPQNLHFSTTSLTDPGLDHQPNRLALLGFPDLVHTGEGQRLSVKGSKVIFSISEESLSVSGAPEDYLSPNIHKSPTIDLLNLADAVFTVSRRTRMDFLKQFPGFPEDRIMAMPLASRFELIIESREINELKNRRFWLSMASSDSESELHAIVRAFQEMRNSALYEQFLVFVGVDPQLQTHLSANQQFSGSLEKILFIESTTSANLRWLYENCLGLLNPTSRDSDILNAVEALSLGTPMILPDSEFWREICQDAAFYVDMTNPEHVSGVMDRLISDNGLRRRFKKKAPIWSKKFAWDDAVKNLHELYRKVSALPIRKTCFRSDDDGFGRVESGSRELPETKVSELDSSLDSNDPEKRHVIYRTTDRSTVVVRSWRWTMRNLARRATRLKHLLGLPIPLNQ